MELDLEEEEPTVLEYARYYGLCKDYTKELPSVTVNFNMPEGIINIDGWDPVDPMEHPSVTNQISDLTKERLTLSKEAALLLKSVQPLCRFPDDMKVLSEGRNVILALKKELPVLHTDNELDFLTFGNAATPNFNNLKLPSEKVNNEKDEGFEWPSEYFSYPVQCNERVQNEKLSISKDALVYLQDALRVSYTPEDSETIKAENLYKPAKLPVTPPLLPLSPPITPYIPSSPANQLELASEGGNSLADEAKELEAQIMAMESLEESTEMDNQMLLEVTETPLISPIDKRLMTPSLKRRADALKVEGPLTPPILSGSPIKKLKSVAFTETMLKYIPDLCLVEEKSDGSKSQHSDDGLFEELDGYAREAKQLVENEKLSGADTTARVDVPFIDFSLPVAPWDEYSRKKGARNQIDDTELSAQRRFLVRVKRDDFKTITSWHGASKLERHLPVHIFMGQNPRVSIEDKLHGETELHKMLNELKVGTMATSSTEVWKKEGLRILDEEEDAEEDLELAVMPPAPRDIVDLARKRKLEMDEANAIDSIPTYADNDLTEMQIVRHTNQKRDNASRAVPNGAAVQLSSYKTPKGALDTGVFEREKPGLSSKSFAKPAKDSDEDLLFGGFSATAALHQFMRTQGKTVKSEGSSKTISNPMPTIRDASVPHQENDDVQLHPLPSLPSVPNELPPCPFIINSSLLQQRSLMKQIEQIYKDAELVYRDYTLAHSPAKEADLILSPSTGLIFTTLQQLKQRALPGQPDRSAIKERVMALQLRYERLVVMVTEGLTRQVEDLRSGRPVDVRDKDALDQFKTFTSQLEAEILIKYIRGGEKALARSAVIEMSKYGCQQGSKDEEGIKLIIGETNWEIFLRRCGFNPFGAQAILWSLKDSVDMPLASSIAPLSQISSKTAPIYGLPAFIAMDGEERVKRLQIMMGGSRILRRVSKIIDQPWVSAAHGFKF